MLDRFKVAAREKLQRAIAEVVAAEQARSRQELADQHAEVLAALDRVNESVRAVVTRIADTEYRARRDVSYAQDVAMAQESAAFVLEHMPKSKVFWEPPDTLRFALGEIKGPGLALEFGVATGSTLQIIAEAVAGDRTVVGFDVFTGLPETWRTGFPAGEFAQETAGHPRRHRDGGLVRGHPARVPRRQRRTDRVRACRLRPVLVDQDGAGSGGRPAHARCGAGVRRVLQLSGLEAARVPGLDRIHLEAQDARSSIWPTRATTNRSSCGCTDQLL